MTGTSLDGLDVALIEVTGRGLGISVKFLRGLSYPLGETGEILKSFASGEALTAAQITAVNRDFALLHAGAAKELLAGEQADLIAVHGQTLFHQPPLSWQLFNPAVLTVETGIPVMSDFRSLDLARGGEGAPITPLSDFISFRNKDHDRVVVNFGGFINLTHLPKSPNPTNGDDRGLQVWLDQVTGRDVCVCNQLLDRAAMVMLGKPCDIDGECGLSGKSDPTVEAALVRDLRRQAVSGKSLGNADDLFTTLSKVSITLSPADLLRTVSASIATILAENLGVGEYDLLVAGGGIHNRCLIEEVAGRCEKKPQLTDGFGIPVSYREAVAMATLSVLALDGIPTTLPQVTGAPAGSGPGVMLGFY